MPRNHPSPEDADVAYFIGMAGLDIRGDLGPYTTYTNRNGKQIYYPRSPPPNKPTPAQKKQRLRFRLAQATWSGISAADKAKWETLCRVLSLCVTGQNLYMSLALKPQDENMTTLILRTGITVSLPTEIPI